MIINKITVILPQIPNFKSRTLLILIVIIHKLNNTLSNKLLRVIYETY